jgi:hypothetical protein
MIVKTPVGSYIELDAFEVFLCEYSPQHDWWYIRAYLKVSFHDWEKSYVIGKEFPTHEQAREALDLWILTVKSTGWTNNFNEATTRPIGAL